MALVVCTTGPAVAMDRAVDVSEVSDQPIRLTEYFGIFFDPDKSLTISEVAAPEMASRFRPSDNPGNALGFAYVSDAVWLRLRVSNTSRQPVERIFEIAYALLGKVDFYQPSADGYQVTELGYARPIANQPHRSRFIVIPFVVPAKTEQTIFVRVETANSVNIPARIWSHAAFDRSEHVNYSVQALYFGIVIGLALYNLMLFFALRDVNYLLYVVFAFSVSVALLGNAGLGAEFIWGDRRAYR